MGPWHDEPTALPRDEKTRGACEPGGRLPNLDDQDWPDRPTYPDNREWRLWD